MTLLHNYFEDADYHVERLCNDKDIWKVTKIDDGYTFILKKIEYNHAAIHLLVADVRNELLAKIYQVGALKQGLDTYVTMEYVEGVTLAEYINEISENNINICLDIAHKLCDAVESLHDIGIIHRDLSDSNIMIQGFGTKIDVKIIDYGNCHIINPDKDKDTTMFGTPEFAAPEQLWGATDEKTDIFAIGKIMCEIITKDITNFEKSLDSISDDGIKKIIRKCTRLDKSERYENISELKNAINQYEYVRERQERKKVYSKNKVLNSFLEWFDTTFILPYETAIFEKPLNLVVPINVLHMLFIIFVCVAGWIIGTWCIVVIPVLLYWVYSRFAQWLMELHLARINFIYPYNNGFEELGKDLAEKVLYGGIDLYVEDDEHLTFKYDRKREYEVELDKINMSFRIITSSGKGLEILRRQCMDYGNIVFMLQHAKSR